MIEQTRRTGRIHWTWGRRTWLAGLVVVALIVGAGVVVGQRAWDRSVPRRIVEQYLDALVAGDVSGMLEMNPVPDGGRWGPEGYPSFLLTDEVQAGSDAGVDGYSIDRVVHESRTVAVHATLETGGRKVPHRFELRRPRDGSEHSGEDWSLLGAGYPFVSLSIPEQAKAIVVNGVEVPIDEDSGEVYEDGQRSLSPWLLPGIHEISLVTTGGLVASEPLTVTVPAYFGADQFQSVRLGYDLTDAGAAEVEKQYRHSLSACADEAPGSGDPCPLLRAAFATSEDPEPAGTWTLQETPAITIIPGRWTGWTVRAEQPGSAAFTWTGRAAPGQARAQHIEQLSFRIDGAVSVADNGADLEFTFIDEGIENG